MDFDGNLTPAAAWLDVPQLAPTATALGGSGGPLNAQALALTARSAYVKAATDAAAALAPPSGIKRMATVYLTSIASLSHWTVPAGFVGGRVRMWGGGRAGGGGYGAGGAGGGGGAFTAFQIDGLTPGASIPYVVGYGGVVATASIFNTTKTAPAGSPNGTGGPAGEAGTGEGCLALPGGNGSQGQAVYYISYTGEPYTEKRNGRGGCSPFGGSGGGSGGSGAGSPGKFPGGGGGSGYADQGNGANGLIIIDYWYTTP